jgi:lipoate-protein ligase A
MFRLLGPDTTVADARQDERLIDIAAGGTPAACIWQSTQSLVVPRTYAQQAGFDDACRRYADLGWPVSVRQSGGGIVPQGPGILNLSLARGVTGKPLDHSTEAYTLICRVISDALHELDIHCHPQAVEGSFCDGRFNLAVGEGAQARKIAGTAQVWRRRPMADGTTQQVGLVHALMLVHTDVAAATAMANGFEEAIGSRRRYSEQKAVSAHTLYRGTLPLQELLRSVERALARHTAAVTV